MKTTIELNIEKTEQNKEITDLCIADETGIGFVWNIYPEPDINEESEAREWRKENYGATELYVSDYEDNGDIIFLTIEAINGTAYAFFNHLAAKYPQFYGTAKVLNNQSSIPQRWVIEDGVINHHFREISWTEKHDNFFIDYRVNAGENDLKELTQEEAEKVIKYHNQGSIYARVIVSVEFRIGMEVISEVDFYYSGLDAGGIYSQWAYLQALERAQNAV